VAGTFNNFKHDYQKVVSTSRATADSQPGPLGAVNRWGNSHPQQAVAAVGVAVACGTGVACVPAIAAAGVAQVGEDVANHCSAAQTAIDGGLSAGGAAVGFLGELGAGALEGSNGIQAALRAHNGVESGGATAAGAC
jgi:hypothetical protein